MFKRVHDEVLRPVIDGMRKEGIPFKGILYAGIIINGGDISVLEFNVRFGDPEAQVIIPLLDGRIGDLFSASIEGNLGETGIKFMNKSAVTVVISSGGYPGAYEKGKPIAGLDRLGDDIMLFHAGTERRDGRFYTNGGRVLNVTALGGSFSEARDRVYGCIDRISFEGAHYRKDIGHRAMKYLI